LTEIALECWENISPNIRGASQNITSDRGNEEKQAEAELATKVEDFYAAQLKDLERQTQELHVEVNNSVNIALDSDARNFPDGREILKSIDPAEDLLSKLSHIIELLFDLTPSIRGLRREYFLLQDKLAAQQTTIEREIAAFNRGEISRLPT
jgi:hypothetical protein